MRIMVAGTGSGCGKTTLALALMAALREQGLSVAPFKAGPDYIDPGFHRLAAGRASHNLDEWLCSPDSVKRLLATGNDADIAVIEGAMGFYDGLNGSTDCSAYALAKHTATPVALVLDGSGSAASAAATALGFLRYRSDHTIVTALVNRVSGERHYSLIREALVAELNLDNIPNLKNVLDSLKDPVYDPGNAHSIPYMWGTLGILYNTANSLAMNGIEGGEKAAPARVSSGFPVYKLALFAFDAVVGILLLIGMIKVYSKCPMTEEQFQNRKRMTKKGKIIL